MRRSIRQVLDVVAYDREPMKTTDQTNDVGWTKVKRRWGEAIQAEMREKVNLDRPQWRLV